jgi:predicted nucleic acid-binding protein
MRHKFIPWKGEDYLIDVQMIGETINRLHQKKQYMQMKLLTLCFRAFLMHHKTVRIFSFGELMHIPSSQYEYH